MIREQVFQTEQRDQGELSSGPQERPADDLEAGGGYCEDLWRGLNATCLGPLFPELHLTLHYGFIYLELVVWLDPQKRMCSSSYPKY